MLAYKLVLIFFLFTAFYLIVFLRGAQASMRRRSLRECFAPHARLMLFSRLKRAKINKYILLNLKVRPPLVTDHLP